MDAQTLQQATPAADTEYSPESAALWLRNMEKRILEGHTPSIEEQKQIVKLVRNNRFAAVDAQPKSGGGTRKKKGISDEDLDSDLDAALGL